MPAKMPEIERVIIAAELAIVDPSRIISAMLK